MGKEKQKKKSYPLLPVAHWWALRGKFKQSMPGVVTANYLATTLDIKPRSARNNVLPYLKDFGLINGEGKTQDLAKAWRDDEQYPAVCAKIRQNIYPEELIAAISDPWEDRPTVERWFANETGAGTGAVQRMAAIYIVISQADLSGKPAKQAKLKKAVAKKKVPASSDTRKRDSGTPKSSTALIPTSGALAPGLNINLEIHISSDATPDQIDRIFESMARHIYKR